MSIVASRSSSRSHSSRSGVGSSGLCSSDGMQFSSGLGGGRSSMSVSSVGSSRAPSVNRGAGKYCTRISQSSFSMDGPVRITFGANEKHTMQNLNDRLATYLEKVRSLETANSKLELQIKEFYEMRSPTHKKDLSGFHATITDIRNKSQARSVENSQMILRVDNARHAADVFKIKLETEANMRMKMEGDVARQRGVLDSFTLTRAELEIQIEGLKEELVYLRKNNGEEMQLMRPHRGAVNVEMDCASSVDMSKVLEEMRTQYEGMITKNQRDAAKWFESKVEVLQNQITTSTTEVKTSQSQVTDLKRTFQSLEIELHGLLTQKGYVDINGRHGSQLSHLQVCINSMEEELQQLNVSIQQQASEYQILLDIKMRLEMEIAEYRRVIEEVVSTVVDEKVQEINELRGRDSSRIW
uniref:Keratin 99 n=1 Tax=Oncorhynchus mykiss TaxID=8022 RepID=A0A8C7VNS5_ONCMY